MPIQEKTCNYSYNKLDDYMENYFTYKEIFYLDFINKYIDKTDSILGIGSGVGAVEWGMKRIGYKNVTCSDLESYTHTQDYGIPYIKFNALTDSISVDYKSIICFGLLYYFNDEEMHQFFENISCILPKGGTFVCDTSGSPDNLAALMTQYALYLEMQAYRIFRSTLDRKRYHVKTTHAGYRRTDEEICTIAKQHGFTLIGKEHPIRILDFEWSMIYRAFVKRIPGVKTVLEWIVGDSLSYFRLFAFTVIRGVKE